MSDVDAESDADDEAAAEVVSDILRGNEPVIQMCSFESFDTVRGKEGRVLHVDKVEGRTEARSETRSVAREVDLRGRCGRK